MHEHIVEITLPGCARHFDQAEALTSTVVVDLAEVRVVEILVFVEGVMAVLDRVVVVEGCRFTALTHVTG